MDTLKMDARMLMRTALAGLLLVLVAACGQDPEGSPDGMDDMPSMSMPASGEPGAGAADLMQAHLARMAALPPDSLAAVLPMHRQMVANELARMNREMREMAMPADSAWNALVDSIRTDLARMPQLGSADLQALMPAHRERVGRLAAMHAAMMRAMGM